MARTTVTVNSVIVPTFPLEQADVLLQQLAITVGTAHAGRLILASEVAQALICAATHPHRFTTRHRLR